MQVPQRPVRASVIELWGTFASTTVEQNFRSEHLAQDLMMTRFLALMYVLTTIVLVAMDWTFKSAAATSLILMVPRCLTVLFTAVLVLRLRYPLTPALLDRWLVGWFSVNLAMELWINSARSGSEAVFAGIFFVWSLASLVPMRLTVQAATATATSIGFMALVLSKRPEPVWLALFAFKLILALAVGLICSTLLQRARRNSFAAHLAERETVVLLEAALAKIQTLEGILPICSACKMIRREDESWVDLDEFVSEVTTARFSHGMCPKCVARFYPNYSHVRQDS